MSWWKASPQLLGKTQQSLKDLNNLYQHEAANGHLKNKWSLFSMSFLHKMHQLGATEAMGGGGHIQAVLSMSLQLEQGDGD